MRNCVHVMYYWVNTLAVLSPGEGQSESWKGRAWNEGEAGLLPSLGEADEVTTIDNIRSQNSLVAFKDGNGPPQHSYLLIWQIAPEDTVATSGEQFFLIHTTDLPCSIRLKMLSVMIFFFCSREGFWAEVALVLLLTAASKIICTAGTWLGSLLLFASALYLHLRTNQKNRSRLYVMLKGGLAQAGAWLLLKLCAVHNCFFWSVSTRLYFYSVFVNNVSGEACRGNFCVTQIETRY